MNIIYIESYQSVYLSDVQSGPQGSRRKDWRFWMAFSKTTVVAQDDCIYGVMDDFGTLVETDGRAYNHAT